MTDFNAIAENYGIADREFKVKLSGSEVLCLISLIQLANANSDPGKFEKHFREAISFAKGLIETVYEVDAESGEQLRSGWGLRGRE